MVIIKDDFPLWEVNIKKKKAFCKGAIMLGDFNLDHLKKHCINYSNKNLFEDFEESLSDLNLIQIVTSTTGSRIVNDCLKESLLDHIYVKDPTICKVIATLKPCFGDQLLIITELVLKKPPVKITVKRDGRKYSKDALCRCLSPSQSKSIN